MPGQKKTKQKKSRGKIRELEHFAFQTMIPFGSHIKLHNPFIFRKNDLLVGRRFNT